MSRAEGEVCWNLGEGTRCYNVGPAEMKCLTCLLDDGNMETWKAIKTTLEKYKQDPAVFNRKEFAIWVNYFYYLQEQWTEVTTWNKLMWYERYVNPPHTLEGEPIKLVHWISPKRYGRYGEAPRCGSCNVQVICPECGTPVPKCIEDLVKTNKSLIYSHYFAVQGGGHRFKYFGATNTR
jgi:hypothetical protein